MSDEYLVVRNWERFQHYKNRNPSWIKNYTELLSSDAYMGLTGHRRAILHGLWLEYARSRCRLPLDTRILTRRLNLKVTTADLVSLNHAGFIHISASNVLANRYQLASPEVEVEVEKEGEPPQEPLLHPEPEPEPLPKSADADIDFSQDGAGAGAEFVDNPMERLNPHVLLRQIGGT